MIGIFVYLIKSKITSYDVQFPLFYLVKCLEISDTCKLCIDSVGFLRVFANFLFSMAISIAPLLKCETTLNTSTYMQWDF